MTDHEERPPSALAHGPVKGDDIERVRRDVDESDARVTHAHTTVCVRERAGQSACGSSAVISPATTSIWPDSTPSTSSSRL